MSLEPAGDTTRFRCAPQPNFFQELEALAANVRMLRLDLEDSFALASAGKSPSTGQRRAVLRTTELAADLIMDAHDLLGALHFDFDAAAMARIAEAVTAIRDACRSRDMPSPLDTVAGRLSRVEAQLGRLAGMLDQPRNPACGSNTGTEPTNPQFPAPASDRPAADTL
jgi:hypothetical protein